MLVGIANLVDIFVPTPPCVRIALGDRARLIRRHICARFQKRLQIVWRDPPFFSDLEAAQMAPAQPLGHRALVHLQAIGDIGWCEQLLVVHHGTF